MRLSAPGWSDWYSLTSDGKIPDDILPCSAFQLRYFMQFQADTRFLDTSTGVGYSTWRGRWQWTIHRNRDDRNLKENPVFDQTVDIEISLIYLSMGVVQYIWYWNEAANKVYTVLPQPVTLVGGTQGGYPTENGWQQVYAERGYADPASGTDYTDYQVYVDTWYHSAAYELNLPSGAYLGIPFHNCGAYIVPFVTGNLYSESDLNRPTVDGVRFLVKYANVQIRARAGSLDAVRCKKQGVAWVPSVSGAGVQIESLVGREPGPFAGTVTGASSPLRLFRFPASTRLGMLCQHAQGARYFESPAEGQEGTWALMGVIRLADNPVTRYTTACLSEDGGMIYLLVPEGDGYAMLHVPLAPRTLDSGTVYDATHVGAVTGLPTVPDGTYMVAQRGRLHIILRGSSGAEYYQSSDGGKSWS